MLRSLRSRAAALLLPVIAFAGCSSADADRILSVDAEGIVFTFLFRDDNLDAGYNAAVDQLVSGARVDVRLSRTQSTRPGGVTDSIGRAIFRVAVGRYEVEVGPDVLGDSLVVEAGNAEFTVSAGDSVLVPIALAFKTITITEARALPPGRAAWVRGIVMNSPFMFGDSTVHLVDDSAAIRTTMIRPNLPLLAGDSALFLGRRIVRDGQPAIELLVIPVIPGVVTPPPPDSVSTATAATAGNGSLDARFAKVAAAAVSDTATMNASFRLTVNDGSGSLGIVLSPSITQAQGFNPNQYAPGAVLDISGMLVPDTAAAGRWVLKPRLRQDITILP